MTAADQKTKEEDLEDTRVRAEKLKDKHLIDEFILAEGIRMGEKRPMQRIKTKFDPAFVASALEILAKYKRN
jgi:hypothetical protein